MKVMVIIILIFLQPISVEGDYAKIFFVDETSDFTYALFPMKQTNETKEQVYEVVNYLLDNSLMDEPLIPRGTKLLDLHFNDGSVDLLFSNAIMNYGGTYWEAAMLYQMLATLFSMEDVKQVSLLIEGDRYVFTEGMEIIDFTKEMWLESEEPFWQEWMKEEKIVN